jgi:hypothetical protein
MGLKEENRLTGGPKAGFLFCGIESVPASPRPRVPASPRPRVPASPRPRVPASPRPRVNQTGSPWRYSCSLLRNVRTLMPRISAALVRLPWTESRALPIISFSISPMVINSMGL